MLSGIKRQGIVGKNGKIEIQAAELAEGTVVEVIVLTDSEGNSQMTPLPSQPERHEPDTTEYLLSNDANRRHLLTSIQQAEAHENLVHFTAEEWNEEHNVHP